MKRCGDGKAYPLCGCVAIPRGLSIPSENKTFLLFVSKLATSMVFFFESVQKMFLADQSMDIPSGDLIPLDKNIRLTSKYGLIG